MKALRALLTILLIDVSPLACVAQQPEDPKPAAPVSNGPGQSASSAPVVYLSDFEIDVAAGTGEKAATPGATSNSATDVKKEETAAERAGLLVELMSITLTKELEKSGYTVHRLHRGEARPAEGVGIRGVFTEPDEQNRLRRAVIGSGPTVGRMAVFVGVSNLARPEQALYMLAEPKSGDKPGAIITVSSYAPVAKFEIAKNPSDKAVQDTASHIAGNLTVLLNANRAALSH